MRDVSFPLRDMRFPSGLRVVIEEDHRTPTVGVFAVVGSGSTSDPPGKEGLAHYVEHLAFRARPDGKTSVWHLLQRAGAGEWNGSTSFDQTTFYEVGPKEALPGLLRLEGVRLLAPTSAIAKETADVEREVVRNELRQRNETGYDGPILGFMQAAVFPSDHPYSRPVIGTHESFSAITFEDAEGFAKAHYRPENMTNYLPFVAQAEQRPEIRANQAFLKALYGDHPYGRSATAKDLGAIGAGDVTRWIDATHVPRNAVLAIVGEIDPDAVARLVVDELGGWSSDQPAQTPPPAPAIASNPGTTVSFVVTLRPGATQSQVRFGCLLPPPTNGSLAAYDLAADVAEEQLTDVVRRKLGASYGFHGAVVALRGGATQLVVQGAVETASTARALAALRDTLASFAQGKLDPQAIDRARFRLASRFGVAFDTTRSLVSAILSARNRGASLASIDAYPEDLIRPSPADLAAVFARCLAGRPVVSIVGDEPAVRAAITEAWP